MVGQPPPRCCLSPAHIPSNSCCCFFVSPPPSRTPACPSARRRACPPLFRQASSLSTDEALPSHTLVAMMADGAAAAALARSKSLSRRKQCAPRRAPTA